MSEVLAVANVFMHGKLAGQLIRTKTAYTFQYDEKYLLNSGIPLSYSLPIQHQFFSSDTLFPYFSGLLCEGWLLGLQTKAQHIDKNDLFTLLVKNGHDLAGAITIELSNLPGKF
jgi:serine/threonine-protein kinase HipA